MGIKLFSYIPAIIGILSIGIFVFLNNPKDLKNRFFALANLNIVLWLICLFVADITKNPDIGLWSLRAGLFFGATMVLFFYWFSLVFPYKSKTNLLRQFLYCSPLISIALLSLTPSMVTSVIIQEGGIQPGDVGLVYTFSDVITIMYVALSSLVLLFKYRHSERRQKNQIKFILIGLFLAVITNTVTGLVLPLLKVNTDYIFLGGFSLFIFSVFVAYAIIKHGFLDIRLLVARSVAYILLFGTLVVAYSAFIFGLSGIFFTSTQLSGLQQVAYIIFAILLAITFQPLKRFFDKVTNKIFYRDAYDPQLLISQLNTALASTIDLHMLLQRSSRLLVNAFKAEFCYFVINRTENVDQIIVGTDHLRLSAVDVADIKLASQSVRSKVILNEYLDKGEMKLKKALDKHGMAVLVRLYSGSHSNNESMGFLILGFKKSGNIYSSQDTKVIETISNELVIAIQNALRFEEIRNFNKTLQGKVDAATGELRVANVKLKQIDKAKDDFISMASHQLRTPLTSIKGYLSMVLEGDVGNVTATQRKVLEEAYTSSQRMVYLIGDFLNVSRIQTGKFELERTRANLAEILTEEINQLRAMAQGRNLKIKYTSPSHFPTTYVDQDKFRQVMMNFIDNAIYYSHANANAEITVQLTKEVNDLVFKVIDQGIGVPADERHKLFTKFYRASNAKRQRPDGTGIGLFMAQKVIVAHGGSVIFESRENQGSTFGFRLPLKGNTK